MSETRSEAIHELLKGLNQETTHMSGAIAYLSAQLTTISQQLLDLQRATSPALGLCSTHVDEWLDAGGDPSATLPAAQTVVILPGVGVVPVCIGHFRVLKAAQPASELVLAQPTMPQQRLVVPGR